MPAPIPPAGPKDETIAVCFECRRVVALVNATQRAADGVNLCPACAARERK